jgi:hypothetical protein
VRRVRSLPGALPTGSNVVVAFSHHYGTALLDGVQEVQGLADVMARMTPVADMMTPPAPGNLRIYHASRVCEGPTYGDGVAVLFHMAGIHAFSGKARSSKVSVVGNGAPMPLMLILRWLRIFNLGTEVKITLVHLPACACMLPPPPSPLPLLFTCLCASQHRRTPRRRNDSGRHSTRRMLTIRDA